MHDHNTIRNIIQATRLSEQEVVNFLDQGKESKIAKKTFLTVPNQMIDKAYFVKKGIARHFIMREGNEFSKNFIRGPRFMLPSLTNFFLQTPSSIYCQSLTDLEVVEWSRQSLFNFSDQNPKMYRFLLRAVVTAFEGKEQKELALNQLDAKQRYVNFLIQFPNLVNEIPIQYVASFLGIRPETLSRIRAKLNS